VKSVNDYLREADDMAGEGGELVRFSPLVPEPGPLHYALVDLLENMLTTMETFASVSGKVPPQLRVIGRTLKTLKPMMLEELGGVPEADIRRFLTDIVIAPITAVIETPGRDGLPPGPAELRPGANGHR
jgi:hypothetical protein